jgi:hypothetical protein
VKDTGKFRNFTFLLNVVGFRITWHTISSSQPMLYNTLCIIINVYQHLLTGYMNRELNAVLPVEHIAG